MIYNDTNDLNVAKKNYTVTERELLIVVFALEKFQFNLVGIKIIVHTHCSALRYMTAKKDVKSRFIIWGNIGKRVRF